MRQGLALFGLALSLLVGVAGASMLVSGPTTREDPGALPGPQVESVIAQPPSASRRPDRTGPTDEPQAALVEGTRILVPRLHIDLPLRPGDSERDIGAQSTPTAAAFLLPGSAVPGTSGNSYIYAHARAGMFLSLWSVAIGDSIEIVGPTGVVLSYTVSEIEPRVAVSDLTYLIPTEDERLTLQTSTGPTVNDPRFVVVARPTHRSVSDPPCRSLAPAGSARSPSARRP